jgi:hypothetical protein
MAERPVSCEAWRADLAAWATAQIAPDREAALDAHLATCAACREEADGLLAIAAVTLAAAVDGGSAAMAAAGGDGTGAADDVPPADLGPRISARLARERRRQTVRRSLVAAVGAAAAAAVLVVAVLVARGDSGPGTVHGREFAFTTLPDGATAEATVGTDDAGSVVQLAATGLDPGRTYALWLSDPVKHPDRVPAGTFRPDADGTVDVVLHCSLPADQVGRVWATSPDGLELDTA